MVLEGGCRVCGCGRVTVHLLLQPQASEFFGCDIERDAIASRKRKSPRRNFSYFLHLTNVAT
jgi:hypothetical protein